MKKKDSFCGKSTVPTPKVIHKLFTGSPGRVFHKISVDLLALARPESPRLAKPRVGPSLVFSSPYWGGEPFSFRVDIDQDAQLPKPVTNS